MSTISERIRQVRLEATGGKLSQDEFAKSLSISRSMVANMEDAENRLSNGIPERILAHICKVYHVNWKWLTEGEGEMLEDLSLDANALVEKYMGNESELTKSIMKAFAKLPDEEWVRLRDLINEIDKIKGS